MNLCVSIFITNFISQMSNTYKANCIFPFLNFFQAFLGTLCRLARGCSIKLNYFRFIALNEQIGLVQNKPHTSMGPINSGLVSPSQKLVRNVNIAFPFVEPNTQSKYNTGANFRLTYNVQTKPQNVRYGLQCV